MSILDRITETRKSLANFDDWQMESLAYGSLLREEKEWIDFLEIRSKGWNRQLITDTDYEILYGLIGKSPHEFNKQPVAVRMTVIKLISETRTILNHSEQRNNNVR